MKGSLLRGPALRGYDIYGSPRPSFPSPNILMRTITRWHPLGMAADAVVEAFPVEDAREVLFDARRAGLGLFGA